MGEGSGEEPLQRGLGKRAGRWLGTALRTVCDAGGRRGRGGPGPAFPASHTFNQHSGAPQDPGSGPALRLPTFPRASPPGGASLRAGVSGWVSKLRWDESVAQRKW